MTDRLTTPSGGGAAIGSGVRVLLADDEPHLGLVLQHFLQSRGHEVTVVRDGRAALDALQRESFDVALLDVVMPELDGLEVLRRVREESAPPEVLVITGNGTVETTLAALSLGAYDVLSKPYRMAEIDARIRRAWEKRLLVRDNGRLRARVESTSAPTFITQYAPLRAVLETLAPVADGVAPVLIAGEAGTGRRTLARWLHAQRRADAPFVELTSPRAVVLAGSEGVGARTGALDAAANGTLYIPELAALEPQAAGWLLDVLDSGMLRRLGGQQPVPLTARVVAATSHDPDLLVREGVVSEALLTRLRTVEVHLPPLHDRAVDIAPLARALVARRRPTTHLADDALALLESHGWPGNVAELARVLDAAMLRVHDGVLDAAALGIGAVARSQAAVLSTAFTPPRVDSGASLIDLERHHIADVLERTHWHQGRAAELLGISPKTLYRKIREYGFRRPSGRGPFADPGRHNP